MGSKLTRRVVKNARRRGVKVYSHLQWGSLSIPTYAIRTVARKHSMLPDRPVDTLWQHITVTYNTGHTRSSFKKDMRTLERIGNERFTTGVPYNFAIDAETGEVGVGQNLEAAGAHTINYKSVPGYSYNQNYVSIAFAVIGMPGTRLSEKSKTAMVELIKALIEEEALTENFDYEPHRLVASKDCPTDNIVNVMPEIRKRVRVRDREPEEVADDDGNHKNIEDAKKAVGRAARHEREKRGKSRRWKKLRRIIRLLDKL